MSFPHAHTHRYIYIYIYRERESQEVPPVLLVADASAVADNLNQFLATQDLALNVGFSVRPKAVNPLKTLREKNQWILSPLSNFKLDIASTPLLGFSPVSVTLSCVITLTKWHSNFMSAPTVVMYITMSLTIPVFEVLMKFKRGGVSALADNNLDDDKASGKSIFNDKDGNPTALFVHEKAQLQALDVNTRRCLIAGGIDMLAEILCGGTSL
jgi:hypothetical protein